MALLASSRMLPQAENTQPKSLPSGVLQALARDEKDYCDQFLGELKNNCKQTFRANLMWREVELSQPHERTAFLIEIHNMGACGSAGCTLYLFVQQDAKFVQILGIHGDVGDLDSVRVLKSATRGYYDIQKTQRNGKTATIYKWDGKRYSAP